MSTLSVPLTPELEEFVKREAKATGSNKAAVVRRALKRLEREEAINDVLEAEKEPTVRGNLKELMKKFR